MKPTKQQRNEIYRYALEHIGYYLSINSNRGLCYLLNQSILKLYRKDKEEWNPYTNSKEMFPEVYSFSPSIPEPDGYWHWPNITDNEKYEIRKVILEFCIEMTN